MAGQYTNGGSVPSAWAERIEPSVLKRAAELAERAERLRESGENILPPQACIFRALDLTPPERVRCVILGQDPYPTPGAANGLAFSANPGEKIPPSLRNIFQELAADLGCPMPSGPDLTAWARQGVLLLNTCLTVRAGEAQSHAKWGWQAVTGDILRVCAELPQALVFLLWGRHAIRTAEKILCFPENHSGAKSGNPIGGKRVICSSHPSPLGAKKGSADIPAFFGSRPFSRTNAFLSSMGAGEIHWNLP